eukprot:TRINITY_DN14356_c0_g1_i1.p1 TRINITY_DN14356_c0_g1~~TRINITY_DN14356_c0_g1_i1.p1  ORF type:complete len:282 (+),score=16.94 TRINITY_DN14356_c0_g1_i1:115-960(+)
MSKVYESNEEIFGNFVREYSWIYKKECEKFSMVDCRFSQIPECIGYVFTDNLKTLNITFTDLSILPESISRLVSLDTLDFSNNNLRIIPDDYGALTNLRVLLIYHNVIESIPDTIGNMVSLTKLDCKSNKISMITDNICFLTNLQTLCFQSNLIEELPESITNLSSLTDFDISINKLTSIDTIENLPSLKLLNFFGNEIENFPDIRNLTSLNILDHSLNEIDFNTEHNQEIVQYISLLTSLKEIHCDYEDKDLFLSLTRQIKDIKIKKNMMNMFFSESDSE